MENKEYIEGFNDGCDSVSKNANNIINDIIINFEAKIKELNEQITELKKEKQQTNKFASSLDALIDYKIDELFKSICDKCILDSGDISPEDSITLAEIIKRFIVSNNQTEWGFNETIDKELKDNFIEVSSDFATMNFNKFPIYGLYGDGKSESLIEGINDIQRFARYVIEIN